MAIAIDSGSATIATVSPARASARRSREAVALAQDGDELGGEELRKGRFGGPGGHGDPFFLAAGLYRGIALPPMKKGIKSAMSLTIIDVYYVNHS